MVCPVLSDALIYHQIPMIRLTLSTYVYVNRKSYHSINVQLVCDENMKILHYTQFRAKSRHERMSTSGREEQPGNKWKIDEFQITDRDTEEYESNLSLTGSECTYVSEYVKNSDKDTHKEYDFIKCDKDAKCGKSGDESAGPSKTNKNLTNKKPISSVYQQGKITKKRRAAERYTRGYSAQAVPTLPNVPLSNLLFSVHCSVVNLSGRR
ncbi:hypothetical protein NQ315_005720 [Exocentrus adspersus]|uniref:Uncharacterized protein n=1 Tax=Exocentrus adspersus TaxID=1586481 RepID=A0AAV8VHW7_9CUCU|nr:hypothetical protein NQ315_005720 [Exocentrus adspersus]